MYVIDHADVCFFFYVNSSFENFLQRKRKTGRTRECIFRASGGTNFEHFSRFGIDGCAILPNVNIIYIYIYIYMLFILN